MKKLVLSLMVVFAVAVQAIGAVTGVNLIKDSSFETRRGRGWVSAQTTTQRVGDDAEVHNGAFSFRLTGDGAKSGAVYQDMKAFDKQRPTVIKLSYWGKITDEKDIGTKGLNLMTKLIDGKEKWSFVPALKMNAEDVGKWVKKESVYKVPAGDEIKYIRVYLTNYDSKSPVWFDDITVEAYTPGEAGLEAIAAPSDKVTVKVSDEAVKKAMGKGKVSNHPASFFDRKGLEKMPRLDYESMPLVNIKELGADSTGKEDVTGYFNKAVSILEAKGGGIVFIPEGVYLFNKMEPHGRFKAHWVVGEPRKTLENIHFVGEGEGSIIKFDQLNYKYGRYQMGWRFASVDNISIRDMSFIQFPFAGNAVESIGGAMKLLVFSDYGVDTEAMARDIQIVNITTDQGDQPLWVHVYTKRCWIVDCQMRNSARDGMNLCNVIDSTVAYTYVENSADDGMACISQRSPGHGMLPSQNTRFIGNTIFNIPSCRGITMGGSNHIVEDNWIERVSAHGIHTHVGGHGSVNGHPLLGGRIRNNTLVRTSLDFRTSGIKIESRVADLEVIGNRILGTEGNGIVFKEIKCKKPWSLKFTLENNEIIGSYAAGILFTPDYSIDGLKIKNNVITDNAGGSIIYDTDIYDADISGNLVSTKPVVTERIAKRTDLNDLPELAQGFTISQDNKGYVDIYKNARQVPVETKWDIYTDSSLPKELPEIDVLTFGANGADEKDDTVAFNQAIASIPADGGILKIPEGTYYFSNQDKKTLPFTCLKHHLIAVSKKNLHIVGSGEKTVLVFDDIDSQGLRMVDVHNSSVRNLSMRLKKQPPLPHNRSLLEISACTDVYVTGVSCKDSSGPGIEVDSSRRVTVSKCKVDNAKTIGIKVVAGRQISILDNTVNNSYHMGILNNPDGSIFRQPRYISIKGNSVDGCISGGGINVSKGTNLEVVENKVSNTYMAGIQVYWAHAWHTFSDVKIIGNELFNCNNGPLSYAKGVISLFKVFNRHGAFAKEIIIKDNHISDSSKAGIWVFQSRIESLIIADNIYKDITGDNVLIDDKSLKDIKKLVNKDK